MWELTTKPAWEFVMYLVELEAGRPSVSPASRGLQTLEERSREVDEEGGHLYDHIKMLYKEDFHPEPVLTQGMEDSIALVSNLSPFLPEA